MISSALGSRPVLSPPCHKQGQYLFSIGKARIHAGGMQARHREDAPWGLVINLTGRSEADPEITQFHGAGVICPSFIGHAPVVAGYPELVIDWPDGHIPTLRRKNWRRLVADLEVFEGDVLIHCHGGHGRTGTLLAILGHLGGPLQGKDSVKWLRDTYCVKVIETAAQITYLRKNMNMKTKEDPRFMPRPVVPVNLPPIGAWWSREERNFTQSCPRDLPPEQYKCVLCCIHKDKVLMHSAFQDGTGYCFLCNAETTARMEYY